MKGAAVTFMGTWEQVQRATSRADHSLVGGGMAVWVGFTQQAGLQRWERS